MARSVKYDSYRLYYYGKPSRTISPSMQTFLARLAWHAFYTFPSIMHGICLIPIKCYGNEKQPESSNTGKYDLVAFQRRMHKFAMRTRIILH